MQLGIRDGLRELLHLPRIIALTWSDDCRNSLASFSVECLIGISLIDKFFPLCDEEVEAAITREQAL